MALQITRPSATVKFYPDQGAAARIDAAQVALDDALAGQERALANPGRTLASAATAEAATAVEQAQAALDEARDSAAASVLDVTLTALPRKRWAEAEENQPARKGDKADELYSVNWDTFLAEVLPESVAEVRDHEGEPVEVTPDEWRAAADEITDGQYTRLMIAVLNLNRSTTDPF